MTFFFHSILHLFFYSDENLFFLLFGVYNVHFGYGSLYIFVMFDTRIFLTIGGLGSHIFISCHGMLVARRGAG